MANAEISAFSGHRQPSFVFDRIGPIADSAFLRNIDPEIVKEITLISARAELAATQTYAKAVEDVIRVVEKSKSGRG